MKNNHSGLTIVELMMAIVISAILVLTIGTMLVYAFLAWRNNSDQVELQRDATFAMDMLSRAIRPAAYYQITTPTPATLTIDDGISIKSFSWDGVIGSSLNYDPDTSVSGDEFELSRNRVTSLQFTNNSPGEKSITINMGLEQGRETLAIDNVTISYRN